MPVIAVSCFHPWFVRTPSDQGGLYPGEKSLFWCVHGCN